MNTSMIRNKTVLAISLGLLMSANAQALPWKTHDLTLDIAVMSGDKTIITSVTQASNAEAVPVYVETQSVAGISPQAEAADRAYVRKLLSKASFGLLPATLAPTLKTSVTTAGLAIRITPQVSADAMSADLEITQTKILGMSSSVFEGVTISKPEITKTINQRTIPLTEGQQTVVTFGDGEEYKLVVSAQRAKPAAKTETTPVAPVSPAAAETLPAAEPAAAPTEAPAATVMAETPVAPAL